MVDIMDNQNNKRIADLREKHLSDILKHFIDNIDRRQQNENLKENLVLIKEGRFSF